MSRCKECNMEHKDSCSCNKKDQTRTYSTGGYMLPPSHINPHMVVMYGVSPENWEPYPWQKEPWIWPQRPPDVDGPIDITKSIEEKMELLETLQQKYATVNPLGPSDLSNLQVLAKAASDKARITRSTIKVGCCIMSTKNKFYSGCNFDLQFAGPQHAEQSAITNMIVNGDADEKISAVLVYSTRDHFTPCGACRDELLHFANSPKIPVCIWNGEKLYTYAVEALLPFYPQRPAKVESKKG